MDIPESVVSKLLTLTDLSVDNISRNSALTFAGRVGIIEQI